MLVQFMHYIAWCVAINFIGSYSLLIILYVYFVRSLWHTHYQLRWHQGPAHHRLFPWLLQLPAVVHKQ